MKKREEESVSEIGEEIFAAYCTDKEIIDEKMRNESLLLYRYVDIFIRIVNVCLGAAKIIFKSIIFYVFKRH